MAKIKELLKHTAGSDDVMKNLPKGYECEVSEDEDGNKTVTWKSPDGKEHKYSGKDSEMKYVHTKDGSFACPVGEIKRVKAEEKNESLEEAFNWKPDYKIYNVFKMAYKDDDLVDRLDKNLTIRQAFARMIMGEDIYKIIKVGDSVMRERVFEAISEAFKIKYDFVYNIWLKNV